ncbi:OsmC family protein [Pseudomonas helleri]|uniref:OsmC family peroxiredoxin n=1 Tax=Pseudomonas helleri TaxID=1608996 RepID=A0A6A7Z411_9PSED|nr:OsmC family protein [Pseudomonas helleri]MQT27883.1 OsmC family peroxiredoxin [Pseudomonas helleri]MQT82545.1 OsmC family peroxiredoxin [Pseudomonas helleri]MQU19068.1 OsmC family peroxiredoxin [Pseudomonas helleri]MQU28995.1 OsmC family peroxiredoxin [Pseudomonas helleri]
MTVTVNTVSHDSFRHSIKIDDQEPVFTDLPKTMGGESSAPSPHDYFDAALGACKALTVKLYAQKKGIPLTGVTVEVKHDATEEQQGKYALHVKLTLKGVLTDAQRDELHRVADKCPVHKLMTTADITIETHLSEGAFSQ